MEAIQIQKNSRVWKILDFHADNDIYQINLD